ncbi:kinase-like domain-containing protein [Ephemerocybe angulata]|uniref:Kinase-like domain-containing protein n=1 Tax=Ephemerocybe angulata TaxID=980116 RepID=A0A8H6I5H7_9AGAR|nr:kinase-like domain-containing protein [Tulosesus angulatus]
MLRKPLKVVLLGATGVGKSTMITQLTERTASSLYRASSTSNPRKIISHESTEYDCEIVEGGIQTEIPLQSTGAFVLMYSVSSRRTLEIAERMYRELSKNSAVPAILVGNKKDVEHSRKEVSREEGVYLSRSLHLPFLESAAYSYADSYAVLELCVSTVAIAHPPPSGYRRPSLVPVPWKRAPLISTVKSLQAWLLDSSQTRRVSLTQSSPQKISSRPWASRPLPKPPLPPRTRQQSLPPTEVQRDDLVNNPNGFIVSLSRIMATVRAVSPHSPVSELYRDITRVFVDISADLAASKALSSLASEQAQIVMDALQMILDYKSAPRTRTEQARVLRLLLKLTTRYDLFPRSLVLPYVAREHTHAVTSGNYGEIWKGRFRGHSVCMKMIKIYQRSDTKRLLRVFAREAIVWSLLEHENLLPFYGIYNLNDASKRICLISPWMENGCIGDYLRRHPGANRHATAIHVCDGLLYLHSQGIVHGDLKGANILVTSSGRACVADFGLSVVIEGEIAPEIGVPSLATGYSSFGGTARWQAPELLDPNIEDAAPTELSDLYSLGCVMYEIYTGDIPFSEIALDATVILYVQSGRQPRKPILGSKAWTEWGLSSTVWDGCILPCWRRVPEERPSIHNILVKLRKLEGGVRISSQPRPPGATRFHAREGWLSSSEVRNTLDHGNAVVY